MEQKTVLTALSSKYVEAPAVATTVMVAPAVVTTSVMTTMGEPQINLFVGECCSVMAVWDSSGKWPVGIETVSMEHESYTANARQES